MNSKEIESTNQSWRISIENRREIFDGINHCLTNIQFANFFIEDDKTPKREMDDRVITGQSLQWISTPGHQQLIKRKRNQHLDNEQKAYLRRILIENRNDKKLICNVYKISASVLRRIYWHTERALNEGLYLIRTRQHKSEIIPEIRLWVERMIKPPKPPITLAKIKNEIFEKFRIDFGIYTIRRLLINELKYTYRKRSSRTQKYATSRIIGVKKLFCTELLKMLLSKELIIIVDESSWYRSLKMEYSWLPRGRSYSIINNIFTGKANLILGTMNNGDWIAMIHSETGDKLKFWLFLKVLEKVWLIQRREIITKLILALSIYFTGFPVNSKNIYWLYNFS